MHARMAWLVVFLGVVVIGAAVRSWGQDRPGTIVPAVATVPAPAPRVEAKPTSSTVPRDLRKLPPLHQQMHLGAQRGADWLFRMNGSDGRFTPGYVPALKTVLEGDHYVRQAGAAFALARAARYTAEARYSARARQAVLTLLADTDVDPQRPGVRVVTLPPVVVNPLAASGLLVLAIHELPTPAEDLLDQGEQLCAFMRAQQQADGSLVGGADGEHAGLALYGLMRSHLHRPAPWKIDVARKALAFYRPWWRNHKNMAFVPWQSAAHAEAFLASNDQAFADFVYEMNDWIREMQYPPLDPRHPLWGGGFMSCADGKPLADPPRIEAAAYAEGLVEACRVARKAGDLPRYQRYRDSLERSLQFVQRLQYTDANTQHFADWYRPALVGGFYASSQDGNLRLDHTQHAVCALVQYLTYVVE